MEETVTIATPDHVDLELHLAGLGSRFAAYIIDLLCLFALFMVLAMVAALFLDTSALGTWVATDTETRAVSWVLAIISALFFLLQWGYFVCCERLMGGQTPGKKCLGIRVLGDNGLPLTLRQAALRNLVRAADMLPPPSYLLAGIVMHLDVHGRRLGDMVAGTLVVRERFVFAEATSARSDWRATWMTRLERGQSAHLILPHGSISAAQLGLIDQFLQRLSTLAPARRSELAQQLLEPLWPVLGEAWQTSEAQPEEVLRQILALGREATVASPSDAGVLHDIAARQRSWQQFQQQAEQLRRGRHRALQALTPDALRALISDYHRLTADLARARSLGADAQTLAALNRLLILGHNVLYGYAQERSVSHPRRWFYDFPRAVREHCWAVGLAATMLLAPACISYVALHWHPELAYDLVAEGFLEATPTDKEHLHHIPGLFQPLFASAIITNNLQVSLLAFGLGLTAGVGTFVVLVYNGIHLGAIAGWLALQGHSRALWGWIMPHGATELLAIVLSGSAGLLLARAIVAPGERRRSTALKHIAPHALHIELGCMVMLLIAGLIEGFISPSGIGYVERILILVSSLCGWLVYLTCAGRKA